MEKDVCQAEILQMLYSRNSTKGRTPAHFSEIADCLPEMDRDEVRELLDEMVDDEGLPIECASTDEEFRLTNAQEAYEIYREIYSDVYS